MAIQECSRAKPTTKNFGSVWVRMPQRSRLRQAIFQVHLWVGLVLAVYAVAIGATGSLLVFADEIERCLEPHLYSVAVQQAKAPLQEKLENIKQLVRMIAFFPLCRQRILTRVPTSHFCQRKGSWIAQGVTLSTSTRIREKFWENERPSKGRWGGQEIFITFSSARRQG